MKLIRTLVGLVSYPFSRNGKVAIANPDPAIDFESLLAKAKETKSLEDLNILAQACIKLNQRIVLAIKFDGIDLVSVISGFPENAYVLRSSLILRFKSFDESDKALSRLALEKITNGQWRQHKPLHCVYADSQREIRIGGNNPDARIIVSIHAESEFDTNNAPAT